VNSATVPVLRWACHSIPQRLRAVVDPELGLKRLFGFVGPLFFLPDWAGTSPVDVAAWVDGEMPGGAPSSDALFSAATRNVSVEGPASGSGRESEDGEAA
jgi:hypothetical protein